MINFREIRIEDAKTILDWRTSDRVTKFMNSDMSYDIDAQKDDCNYLKFSQPN